MKVTLGKEMLIYCAPITEGTKQWGVYCIPRMWRLPDGDLLIYANGDPDLTAYIKNTCPNLYFRSTDNGETWEVIENPKGVDLGVSGNVDSPYLKLPDGKSICIRGKDGLRTVDNEKKIKCFSIIENGDQLYAFRQGDFSNDVFACELHTYQKDGTLLSSEEVSIDFPEREILLFGKVWKDGVLTEQSVPVKPDIYTTPYITSLKLLSNGELVGVCFGQNPETADRYCGEMYLMVSKDGGKSWEKRSCITKNSPKYPFGLAGDGGECSLDVGINGELLCVTRTDMSIEHPKQGGKSDTMMFTSTDNGYTWSEERSVADSSVTPHIIALKNGTVALVYGRPGVHMRVSKDGGKMFGEPISIIGKTLEEELAEGRSYMTCKYFDTCSYSNTFVEVLSENSFLILYTNLKYDPGDGKHHKAGFVRKITIE